jgi:anti-sigma factor (TIGR02949 family)
MSEPRAGLDCGTVVRRLFDYLDGELSSEREAAMRSHLAVCARCYPHYDFERRFLEALAATREDRPAPETLRARVLESLRASGFSLG